MNLYEFEGKQIVEKQGISIPKGIEIRNMREARLAYESLTIKDVVVKAQVLSGKRGKNNAIRFCSTVDEVEDTCKQLFEMKIKGMPVVAIRIEEKIEIAQEQYVSITYDTAKKTPVLIYSTEGGMEIEDVAEEKIQKIVLDIRNKEINFPEEIPYAQKLWNCFLEEDARLVEINPLVKTTQGAWIALDAKVILDDDAFFRHDEWQNFEPRTMMGRELTEREIAVQKIDEGDDYYRGTAGKYVEMDGDIAILFSGGGASIANMDALLKAGGRPANYTEYSGNPPREKVEKLTKIVLSKPGLKGLWIAGSVANFTDIKETFLGIIDVLDEIKPTYPIVVRRAGPHDKEGFELMRECARRNDLNMKLFGKEMSMGKSAEVLMEMIGGE